MRTLVRMTWALVLLSGAAQAQSGGDETKVIVVPVPAEVVDAGVAAEPAPVVAPVSAPLPKEEPPPVLTPKPAPEPVAAAEPTVHPREGTFLSGPGSLAFILHHTLLGGLGVLATQMIPRVIDSANGLIPTAFDQNARLAYLLGGLAGAAIGFGASSIFQFYAWQSEESAGFAALHSFLGALMFFGLVNLGSTDPYAHGWFSLLGAELAGWGTSLITAFLMNGEFPVNKGLLIASGAIWAAYYTAIVLAVLATTGNGSNVRAGVDAMLIAPGVGAAVMALAALKLNPSSAHVLRATGVGLGVGVAGFLLSALVLGARFDMPWPYLIGGVLSAGTTALVAFLWNDAAETAMHEVLPESAIPSRRVYW